MATTEIKTLEKLVKEILEKVKSIGEQKPKESFDAAFDKINTKLETIDERLCAPNSNDNISAEIISKVEKLDEKTRDYLKEIQDAFENYKNNQAQIISGENGENTDLKDFASVITNELSELKEQFEQFNTEFTDISLNTGMAVSKEVVSLKNHVLALNDSVENIKKEIEDYNSAQITADFKNDVFSVLAKITDAANNAVQKIADLSGELKTFEGLELSLGEIKENQSKNKTEILKVFQKNIEEENKKLLPQIMQLVNSISFDESAEEIKDGLYAVNENLAIVNKNIETGSKSTEQILGQIDDISKNVKDSNEEITTLVKQDLIDKLSQMNTFLSDVSNDFELLTKGSKADTENYLYSLLDLESDISKVRIILDELNHTIQDDRSLAESVTKNISDKISNLNSYVEQTSLLYTSPDYKEILMQFEALNDDITSISKRTNKLILTSDDASEKLQKNIEDFQKIMVKISETVKNFENSSVFKNLNIKTDNIQKLLIKSVQSDNAVNEAFVYLANWIDTTSEEIKTIKTDLSDIKNSVVNEDSETEDLGKIEKLLKETTKKLAENAKRMDIIEEKLNNTSAMVTTLEFISGQVQVINENMNANKTLAKKIDKMEKQLQRLLSYVEEDEE